MFEKSEWLSRIRMLCPATPHVVLDPPIHATPPGVLAGLLCLRYP